MLRFSLQTFRGGFVVVVWGFVGVGEGRRARITSGRFGRLYVLAQYEPGQ